MDAEWDKLLKQIVWDMSIVREYDDVVAEAKMNRIKVHFGDIFGICGLKGSELPEWSWEKMEGTLRIPW